ncbi:MAG TPA: phosphoribosylformylglycinamidine cyclo-ligase [Clostridia bacterium]|nr:phosphoribosylformylglycinamidine cyclo-ligase [Clostridia bacterium]
MEPDFEAGSGSGSGVSDDAGAEAALKAATKPVSPKAVTTEAVTYKAAGVDIDEGDAAVRRIIPHALRTKIPGVLAGVGGFGGLFDLGEFAGDLRHSVLVAGADGVGTKLKIAFMMDKHDTVGIDCVAMNCNDILCSGATPLFFLDYIATGRLDAGVIESIVKGIADGCIEAGCALLGGETAEMPGFYAPGEYDLAGFAVGAVSRDEIIDGEGIRPGDVILGIASSGLHSNGYSLVRKAFFEMAGMKVDDYVEEFGTSLGEELLKPTRIYVKSILTLVRRVRVLGLAHITGGGLVENLPRSLPAGTVAVIRPGSWEVPPVFAYIERLTGIDRKEAYRTFNWGIGMVAVVRPEDADTARRILSEAGERVWFIGEIRQSQSEGINGGSEKPFVVFEE